MHSGMNGNGNPANDPRLTSLDAWLSAYEVVKLPSGKVIAMRPVDVLTLMNRDGKIPQVLKNAIDVGTHKIKSLPTTQSDDNLEVIYIAEKVLRAGLLHPPLVENDEDERAGKGIQLIRFTLNDKAAIFAWAMGGQPAVDAMNTFLIAETASLQSLPSGDAVQPAPIGDTGDTA
jgi:hypothetical protein